MTGVVHAFDGREGGGLQDVIVYPEDDTSSRGKTSQRTDTFRGRFVKLIPYQRIVWATEFESADTSFAGEMTVDTTLAPAGGGTKVTIRCENIPPGIRPPRPDHLVDRTTAALRTAFRFRRRFRPPAHTNILIRQK